MSPPGGLVADSNPFKLSWITMRKFAVLMTVAALLAGNANSLENEIGDDFMQAVEDTNKSLAANIADRNQKASLADARELEAMFTKVEAFYVGKGDAEDAVGLSKKSRTLSIEIGRHVDGKNFDAATVTATELSRTCKACHNFYKKS